VILEVSCYAELARYKDTSTAGRRQHTAYVLMHKGRHRWDIR